MRLLFAALATLIAAGAGPASAALYQQRTPIACIGNICVGSWATIPAGQAVTAQTISCNLTFGSAINGTAEGSLYNGLVNDGFTQYFVMYSTTPTTMTAAVQNVPFNFGAGTRPTVKLVVKMNATPTSYTASCDLRGNTAP